MAAGSAITVTAPTGRQLQPRAAPSAVAWTTTPDRRAASSRSGSTAARAAGTSASSWPPTAAATYKTNVTLNLPPGTGYHVVVGYRDPPGVGAFTTFGVGSAASTWRPASAITVTAPTAGSYTQGGALGRRLDDRHPDRRAASSPSGSTPAQRLVRGQARGRRRQRRLRDERHPEPAAGTGYHVVVGYRDPPGARRLHDLRRGAPRRSTCGEGLGVTAPNGGENVGFGTQRQHLLASRASP